MQDDRTMLEGWKLVFRALMQMVYAMTARRPEPAEIDAGQEDFTRALQAMLDAPVRLDGSVQIEVTRVGEDGVRRGFMIYAPDQDEWEVLPLVKPPGAGPGGGREDPSVDEDGLGEVVELGWDQGVGVVSGAWA